MAILSSDVVVIPPDFKSARALVIRDDSLVVLSECCLSVYEEKSASGVGVMYYVCVTCANKTTATSYGWTSRIKNLSDGALDRIHQVGWSSWLKYWFDLDDAEVIVS